MLYLCRMRAALAFVCLGLVHCGGPSEAQDAQVPQVVSIGPAGSAGPAGPPEVSATAAPRANEGLRTATTTVDFMVQMARLRLPQDWKVNLEKGSAQGSTGSIELVLYPNMSSADPHFKRQLALRDATEFGMKGLLNQEDDDDDVVDERYPPERQDGRITLQSRHKRSVRVQFWLDTSHGVLEIRCRLKLPRTFAEIYQIIDTLELLNTKP